MVLHCLLEVHKLVEDVAILTFEGLLLIVLTLLVVITGHRLGLLHPGHGGDLSEEYAKGEDGTTHRPQLGSDLTGASTHQHADEEGDEERGGASDD